MFSLNPETGAYTLVQSERLDRLDPKAFFALVEKFVNTLATWKGISVSAQGETPAPPPPNDGAGTPSLESLGFMQV